MAYLCSYLPRDPSNPNQLGESRILTRGFACTSDELPREIATACRANLRTLSYQWIPESAIETWQEYYRENAMPIYINREGLDQ